MSESGGHTPARGQLFVVSAPSGAGKTSLLKALIERTPRLVFSISYTTRSPRPGEMDGRDYHFIDLEHFRAMRAGDEFLESAEVFGNGYGTAAVDVAAERAEGRDVVLEIDWQGARQVRERRPETVSIFILPPSRESLRARLTGRGTDSERIIDRRMAAAATEMAHWDEYDYVVVNDEFESALADLAAIVAGKGAATERSRPELQDLASKLLAST
ncbi:MAG: guanylate kinase [Gammaproteobacteria bacterium]